MATVYSTQRTNNRATPVAMNKANELGGRIRVAHGVYEASSLASGDVIEMFILPDGARMLEGSLAHDALGSSTTLSVGTAAPPIVTVTATPLPSVSVSVPEPRAKVARISTFCADVDAAAALKAAADALTAVPAAFVCAAVPTDKVVDEPNASCASDPSINLAPSGMVNISITSPDASEDAS